MEPNWLNAREARAWRAFIDAHDQIEVHLNRRPAGIGPVRSRLFGPGVALGSRRGPHARPRPVQRTGLGEEPSLPPGAAHAEGRADRPRAQPRRRPQHHGLPAAGWRAAIEKAAPGHVADVRRNFIDLFTPAELDMLATLNERVLHHLATNYDSPAEDEPS